MKHLFNKINELELTCKNKSILFILAHILIFGMLGNICWLIISTFFFNSIYGMLCFTGYPAIFLGLFGSTLYLYNHEFKSE